MLEPSSSEDENESKTCPEQDDTSSALSGLSSQRDSGRQSQATNPSQNQNQLHVNSGVQRSVSPCVEPSPPPASSNAQQHNYLTARASLAHLRATSPNPPELMSNEPEKDEEEDVDETDKAEREEVERKTRLQLYVLVLRCIAYPFNATQTSEPLKTRNIKVTLSQLEQIVNRFASFLKGELTISADESFVSAIHNYYEAFLKSNRLHMVVASGACSAEDFREVFRKNIEKRVKSLPEVEDTTKESIISQWLTKFDVIFRAYDEGESKKLTGSKMQQYQQQQQNLQISDTILTKEQLYDTFQNILKIKKFEHQLLYNALQVSVLIFLLMYSQAGRNVHFNFCLFSFILLCIMQIFICSFSCSFNYFQHSSTTVGQIASAHRNTL